MKIQTFEIAGLQILDPRLLPEPDAALFSTTNWDVLTPSPARQEIDGAVFDALSLTTSERDAVYEGVTKLVENRKKKAGSL